MAKERRRRLLVKNAKYEVTAVKPEQYPAHDMPEIAFVGRSNVGKSSIINTLTNRKNLARTGATPGKTRQINFYNIDNQLYFVDLPGYGYASVSKGELSSWGKLADTYLTTREQLKLILLLVDIRHTPSKDDQMMYRWLLENKVPHMIVATKSDKISRSQLKPRIQDIRKTLGAPEEIQIVPFSSLNRQGLEEVWQGIEAHKALRQKEDSLEES